MAELKDRELEQVNGGINIGTGADWNSENQLPTEPGNYKLPSDVDYQQVILHVTQPSFMIILFLA